MRTRHVSANIKQTMRQSLGTADIREVGRLFNTRSGSVGWQEISTDAYQGAVRDLTPRLQSFSPAGAGDAIPISWTRDLTLITSGQTQTHGGTAGETPARYVAWVVLRAPDGDVYWHLNTHYISAAWTRKPERRPRWNTHNEVLRDTVRDLLRDHGPTGIITGDFNRNKYVDPVLVRLGADYHWPASGTFGGGSKFYDYLVTFGQWSSPSVVTKLRTNSDHDAPSIDLTLAAVTAPPPPKPPPAPVPPPPIGAPKPPVALPPSVVPEPVVSVWQYLSDAEWGKVATLGAYETLAYAPTFQDAGAWSMTIPYADGAELLPKRIVAVDWRGVRSVWLIETFEPEQPEAGGSTMLVVGGPAAVAALGRGVMLTDPAADLTAQPVFDETKAAPIKAPAETVLIDLVNEHYVGRYGARIRVPVSLGRGEMVPVRPKVGDNLFETMQSVARQGGIGFDITLEGAGTKAARTFRVQVPEDKTGTVRLQSSLGTIAAWKQADTAPTATRALVGSGDTKKRYTWVTTETSEAAAAFWGGHREVYVDGPTSTDPDEIVAAGRAALANSAEGRALSVTPAEAEGMQAFVHYNVSDVVSAEVATGATAEAAISSIAVEVGDGGVTVRPTFGEPGTLNSSLGLGDLLRGVKRDIRRVERN